VSKVLGDSTAAVVAVTHFAAEDSKHFVAAAFVAFVAVNSVEEHSVEERCAEVAAVRAGFVQLAFEGRAVLIEVFEVAVGAAFVASVAVAFEERSLEAAFAQRGWAGPGA